MKFRPQRGGLEESMRETIEVADMKSLATHLGVDVERIVVRHYGFDSRIGWDTHIVTIDGEGVGFTDGPLG
jgi:hypothetical protein